MCGIIGIMSETKAGLTYEQYEAFKAAWVKAEDRGNHAAGYIASNGRQLFYWKSPIPSTKGASLMDDTLPFRPGLRFLLGHTRWATSGDPADNINNHPLIVGREKDLMGIHNGMISNKEELLETHKWEAQRGVDTEIIFRLIHHYGPKSLKPFQELEGSFNLAYVSRRNAGEFYLVRKSNPLVLKKGKDFLAFGSMRYYWDSLEGNIVPVDDNSVMLIGREGIKSIRPFKPKRDFWQRTRTIPIKKQYHDIDRINRYYAESHQESWWNNDGEEMIVDPATGSIEKLRDMWPH